MYFLDFILNFFKAKVESFGEQYRAFGYYVVIQYPISYFVLSSLGSQVKENPLIRFIAILLAVPLLLTDAWPAKLKKYLPTYWHFNIMFSTPLFCTYMLFVNNFSVTWLMNITIGLFTMILLVDWVCFLIHINLGVLLGALIYLYIHGSFNISIDSFNLTLALYMYFYAFFVGFVFSRNKEIFNTQKIHVARALSGTVAHEANTPLAGLMGILEWYRQISQQLSKTPTKTKDAPAIDHQSLTEITVDINKANIRFEKYLHKLRFVMNSLRNNLSDLSLLNNTKDYSAKDLVLQTLDIYPFQKNEKDFISLNISNDFHLKTNKELFVQALSNLIKNALFAIKEKEENKGRISIIVNTNGERKSIQIKDNGCGIGSEKIKTIFASFVTTKLHGMGLGLPFVKKIITASGGSIQCTSHKGQHTTFSISF